MRIGGVVAFPQELAQHMVVSLTSRAVLASAIQDARSSGIVVAITRRLAFAATLVRLSVALATCVAKPVSAIRAAESSEIVATIMLIAVRHRPLDQLLRRRLHQLHPPLRATGKTS